jgi:predicted dehydrogenase
MRIGLIGYGVWARKALARNLANHCEIVWVCDEDKDAARAAVDDGLTGAAIFGVENVSSHRWDSIDAICVATPIATHYDLVTEALEHRKHVLCEKPLATTGLEAVKLAELAEAMRCCLYVDHTWTHHPAIQRGAQVAKELGAPLWFRSVRTSWDDRGLDPIADLLPHDVSILKLWTGQRVAEVSATARGATASVAMVTTGGVVANVVLSYRDRTRLRTVELGCERGKIHNNGAPYICWDVSGAEFDEEPDGPEPLDAMCAEFVRRVVTREPGNIDEAIHVAQVIEAAHRSVAERRVVTL